MNDCFLRRICGFTRYRTLPSEATFSLAFDEFAAGSLGQRVHETLIPEHLGDQLIGHLSRDGTAIEARERPAGKGKGAEEGATKAQPPPVGDRREPCRDAEHAGTTGAGEKAGPPAAWRSASGGEGLADRAPARAKLGANAPGDSRRARTARASGTPPLIDHNPRRGEKIEFSPAEAIRYNERSAAERSNARLRDESGGRHIRAKGHIKVMAHLIFGLLALSADQLMRLPR